jgi:hypothetical protein
MSEKMYASLLRLYPSGFRRKYEDAAARLIRDRLRDEASSRGPVYGGTS